MPEVNRELRYRREMQEQRIRGSRITLVGQAIMAPPTIVAMLLLDSPPLWVVGIVAAFTPANFTFMWVQAQKHGSLPADEGGLGLRIASWASVSVVVLMAMGLAYGLWGPLAGALGTVAYATSLWFTARFVGLFLEIRRARSSARTGARGDSDR